MKKLFIESNIGLIEVVSLIEYTRKTPRWPKKHDEDVMLMRNDSSVPLYMWR